VSGEIVEKVEVVEDIVEMLAEVWWIYEKLKSDCSASNKQLLLSPVFSLQSLSPIANQELICF